MEDSTVKPGPLAIAEPPKSQTALVCEYVKLFVASCVVLLLIIVAFTGISLQYSVLQLFPLANFVLLFFALTLLGSGYANFY